MASNQYRELAQTIANQAQAIADGVIPAQQLKAQLGLLTNNVATLKAWTPDPGDPGYCEGCGVTFNGAKGLRAHQSTTYVTLSCKRRSL